MTAVAASLLFFRRHSPKVKDNVKEKTDMV